MLGDDLGDRLLGGVAPKAEQAWEVGNLGDVAAIFGAVPDIDVVISHYGSPARALEGVSEELAIEVAPFGVRVAIIEPGATKSSIFAKNVDLPNESGAYGQQYERMMQMYAAGHIHATDAVEVARIVLHAIETDEPKLRYPVSWSGQAIVDGRTAMTDEQWVEMGRVESLDG